MSLRDSQGTPDAVKRLLDDLTNLPGIGKRSAERIVFYLIKEDKDLAISLSKSIEDVKCKVVCCEICNNIETSLLVRYAKIRNETPLLSL